MSLKKTALPEDFAVLPMVWREEGQLAKGMGESYAGHMGNLSQRSIRCGYGMTDIFHIGSGFVYLVYNNNTSDENLSWTNYTHSGYAMKQTSSFLFKNWDFGNISM